MMNRKLLDEVECGRRLAALNAGAGTPWEILDGKLHKAFEFQDFVEAFGFMTRVALAAERLDHHPDWSNSYRRVVVDLVNHGAGGITPLDFELATRIEVLLK